MPQSPFGRLSLTVILSSQVAGSGKRSPAPATETAFFSYEELL